MVAEAVLTAQQRQALSKITRAARPYISKFRAARKKRQSYKAKARSQTGEKPGTDLSKATQFRTDGATSYASHTLNAQNALEIYRRSGSFSLGERLRDIIYLSGIKLCMSITNTSGVGGQFDNLYVNVALISGKNRGQLDGTDFFRNYNGNSRGIDFTNASLTGYDRHCLPLNGDEIVVHFHQRKLLMGSYQTSVPSSKDIAGKFWNIEQYIPIKRQIRFEGDGATSETPFKLVWWCGKQGDGITASQTPVAGSMSVETRMVYYFKEPTPVYKLSY